MSSWKSVGQLAGLVTGMPSLFLGIFLCLRRLEIYYYAYNASEIQWTVSIGQEAADWALGVGLIVGGVFLLRFAKGRKSKGAAT